MGLERFVQFLFYGRLYFEDSIKIKSKEEIAIELQVKIYVNQQIDIFLENPNKERLEQLKKYFMDELKTWAVDMKKIFFKEIDSLIDKRKEFGKERWKIWLKRIGKAIWEVTGLIL